MRHGVQPPHHFGPRRDASEYSTPTRRESPWSWHEAGHSRLKVDKLGSEGRGIKRTISRVGERLGASNEGPSGKEEEKDKYLGRHLQLWIFLRP